MSETWIAVVAVVVGLFVLNAALAYRYRSRQLRSQGHEPPPFLVYLFFPKPFKLTSTVSVPRPVRLFLGAVFLIGGSLFMLGGGVILANLDYSKLAHPVGSVVMLLVLLALGLAIAYIGVRLIVMKKDDPLLKGTKSGQTSDIGAA